MQPLRRNHSHNCVRCVGPSAVLSRCKMRGSLDFVVEMTTFQFRFDMCFQRTTSPYRFLLRRGRPTRATHSPIPAEVICTSELVRNNELASVCPTSADQAAAILSFGDVEKRSSRFAPKKASGKTGQQPTARFRSRIVCHMPMLPIHAHVV